MCYECVRPDMWGLCRAHALVFAAGLLYPYNIFIFGSYIDFLELCCAHVVLFAAGKNSQKSFAFLQYTYIWIIY